MSFILKDVAGSRVTVFGYIDNITWSHSIWVSSQLPAAVYIGGGSAEPVYFSNTGDCLYSVEVRCYFGA